MGERIIETVTKTRKEAMDFPRRGRRSRRVAAALVIGTSLLARAADKPRKPAPVNAAPTYALHDTHAAEHVTVAVQPGDTEGSNPDTRLDYLHHGYMPLRVIVTNDSDQPVDLDQARILFVAADNSVTNSATEDDLQRRLFTMKQVQPTRVPLIPITIHHEQVDKKIVNDMDDFGFASTTVAPHSTAGGWLFYNVRDLDDPVLENAVLELRRIRFAAADGKPEKTLDTFEIKLKPTPAPKKDDKARDAATAGKDKDKIKVNEFAAPAGGSRGTR